MATAKTRKQRPPQAPMRRGVSNPLGGRRIQLAVAAAIVVIGVAIIAVSSWGGGSGGTASVGLPNTSDYHSLLVSPRDPRTILLGTHDGLYRSEDGGEHWARYALAGNDAMNLVRYSSASTVWMAGHDVFARSTDGGSTWQSLNPRSLPSLDLHGFAVDPRNARTLYAAVAGQGLYRSDDGGASFRQLSLQVGGAVMALAVTPEGEILAGDMQRGLLTCRDSGRTWREALNAQLAGLALDPANPRLILASGPGILRSGDGGRHWQLVKRLDAGAGPIAFAPSNPRITYAVGFDRVLYRSSNAGVTWSAVGGGS